MLKRTLAKRNYKIRFFIGEGKQGGVYCVEKTGSTNLFACKIIKDKKMWEREVCFLKMVQSEAFPEYCESWWEETFGILIMEYIEGQSLEAFVDRRKYITERRMYSIANEIAGALAYLHRRNPPILFRDLKPSNIRILSSGKVKLVDLGAACQMEEVCGRGIIKRGDFSIAGTLGYAAPEQFGLLSQIGTYSDVYAFGKLLYYLLKVTKKHGRIWYRMKRIAEGCIQKKCDKRFPDMGVVFCKLQNKKRIIYNVCYEKSICIHNSH